MDKYYHSFRVGMTCEGCSNSIKKVLDKNKDKGIENINIDLINKTVKVLSILSAGEVAEIIKKTGKSVEILSSTKA